MDTNGQWFGHARLVLARDATMQGLLVCQSRGLHAVCQTHSDVVKEARPQRHTYMYVCSEMRTVIHRAVLT